MTWALTCQLDKEPTDETLALALAKTALETGRWTQIWRNNWGNIKAGDNYPGMFTCITLNEVLTRGGNQVVVWFAPEGELTGAPNRGGKLVGAPLPVPDGHPQTRMRAYANASDGVDSYVDFVANGRYIEAWKYLLRGDALAYVHALKQHGYFTADEAVYARGVVSLQREYLARIRREEPAQAVDLEWWKLRAIVPNLQFDLSELVETSIGAEFAEAVA
jgi:hypothetical protein